MAKSSKQVVLELSVSEELGHASMLIVGIENRSSKPLTLVTAPQYFKVELESEGGQYVNGESTLAPSLPSAKDYRTIAPHSKEKLLELAIQPSSSSPHDVSIGHYVFIGVPSTAKVRVTYKAADRIMPNLAERDRRTFFPGPADGVTDSLMLRSKDG